jgi:ABC-2 type transport system ATP-binding protein
VVAVDSFDLLAPACMGLGTTARYVRHPAWFSLPSRSVIAKGRIVAEGTPGTLGGRERMAALIRFTLPDGLGLPEALREHVRSASEGRVVLESREPLADVRALAEWALGRGLDLPDLDVRRPSLEDVYLELTEERA